MNWQTIIPEQKGNVTLLTLSRPEALNALNTKLYSELNKFLDILSGEGTCKTLVITGEGKSFVAGADIAEMSGMNSEQGSAFSKIGQDTFDRFESLPFPIIAAINGFALGGGLELAMACDFRFASNKAKFGQPELNLGLIPGYAGTQRLSRLAGLGNALWLILTGDMITAEEALRIGLVQKVTEPEQLLEVTLAAAEKISSNGSLAAFKAKRVIRDGFRLNFKDGCLLEQKEFGALFNEATSQEGMKAFLEKRKPSW